MPVPPPRPRSLERLDRRKGFFPAASQSSAAPQARPALSPPPESITTAGQRCPRLSQRAHCLFEQVCGQKGNPQGQCRTRPAWLAGKLRASAHSRTPALNQLRRGGLRPLPPTKPAPRSPGLVPIGVRNLPLFLYNNFLKHSRSQGGSPPALPIFSPPSQPTETDRSVK